MAKLTKKVGYNPEYWGNQPESEFLKKFEGVVLPDELKKIHAEDAKKYAIKKPLKKTEKLISE